MAAATMKSSGEPSSCCPTFALSYGVSEAVLAEANKHIGDDDVIVKVDKIVNWCGFTIVFVSKNGCVLSRMMEPLYPERIHVAIHFTGFGEPAPDSVLQLAINCDLPWSDIVSNMWTAFLVHKNTIIAQQQVAIDQSHLNNAIGVVAIEELQHRLVAANKDLTGDEKLVATIRSESEQLQARVNELTAIETVHRAKIDANDIYTRAIVLVCSLGKVRENELGTRCAKLVQQVDALRDQLKEAETKCSNYLDANKHEIARLNDKCAVLVDEARSTDRHIDYAEEKCEEWRDAAKRHLLSIQQLAAERDRHAATIVNLGRENTQLKGYISRIGAMFE